MAYHITIIIRGAIDWETANYQAVLATGRRSNLVTLARAIEYTRATLLKGKKCHVEQATERKDP